MSTKVNTDLLVSTYDNYLTENKPLAANKFKNTLIDKIERFENRNKYNSKLEELKKAVSEIQTRAAVIRRYLNFSDSGRSLQNDFEENGLIEEEQILVIRNLESTEKKIAGLGLDLDTNNISRIAQFTEVLKLRQQKDPNLEGIFRKNIYNLPYSIKLSNGTIYLITRERSSRSQEVEEEVKVIWEAATQAHDKTRSA